MRKKEICSIVVISLGTAGIIYGMYRRLMKLNSRGNKELILKSL